MRRLREQLAATAITLSARLGRRHRRVSDEDLAAADNARPPRLRFDERLREHFRKRWLRIRK
jgi:hypothetical protein